MKQEKALIIGKKIECIIGIIFLIPPIISVFCFLLEWFGVSGDFTSLYYLSGMWDAQSKSSYEGGVAVAPSPAPIYLGLMAIAGAYLIKDSIKYLLAKTPKEKEEE